jgi:hypothetical protein
MDVLVIHFINSLWVPCHVTMGFFETTNMSRIAMAVQVKDFLSLYNLLNKLIAYVKDEGGNLSTLAQALTLVVNCGLLGLVVLWQGFCFGHVFN